MSRMADLDAAIAELRKCGEAICRSLLKAGILSQADFDDAERCLRAKYQPIFTAA